MSFNFLQCAINSYFEAELRQLRNKVLKLQVANLQTRVAHSFSSHHWILNQYWVFAGKMMCLIYLGSCLWGCGTLSNHCYCLTIWWYDIVCSYHHKLGLSINWSADWNLTLGIIKCFLQGSRLEWMMKDKWPLNIIHH